MWEYSDKVMDHYRNPRNVGSIENATVTGEAGSLSCGDMLKIYLKIDDKGIVTDAKFQTFGCGSAVASSSILTEMIIGKSIDEVRKITNKEIAEELGGLPPEKMHCSVMGHEALEDALNNYFQDEEEQNYQEKEDKIICNCFQVSENLLRKEIEENNIKTLEEVTNYLKAGGACGRCKGAIENILNEINQKNCNTEKIELTATQLILKINNVIDTLISSQLRKEGGDIELIDVDVENMKVKVKLKGSCKGCKNSLLTLKNFVEVMLKEHVDNRIEVLQV